MGKVMVHEFMDGHQRETIGQLKERTEIPPWKYPDEEAINVCANRLRSYQRLALAAAGAPGSENKPIIDVKRYEPATENDMATVKDVVCGMNIDPGTASSQTEYQGKSYHFCSNDCHVKFMADSEKYASQMVETGEGVSSTKVKHFRGCWRTS